MDTWMVAVAAGASFIAQHFKKSKQTGEQLTSESSSFNNNKPNSPKRPPENKCPFRKLKKKDDMKQDDSKVKEVSQEGTSTSEFDSVNGVISGSCEGSNVFSLSTLFRNESIGTPRNRMPLKNRRTIKPLTSLQSCVMAQLHNDHFERREYISSPFSSPSSKTMRPFLVTDGSKVINRSSGGVSIVPNNTSSDMKQNDAMLHVCIGMSFGILYSFMANRREVEKLNGLLKQTKNLVQDLEEELEMKDSLVMQELTSDDQKSQRTNTPLNLEELMVSDKKEIVIEKGKDESFSEIEAELEAQLEMLELSMTSSTLDRRISDLYEIDPDFEPGVAHGELRADMVPHNRNQDDTETTNATPCANYVVSPRELSLRLHELLQSQLEQRIKELEAEIQTKNNTQIHEKSWKDFSSSEAGDEDPNPNPVDDEPVVLNLSGEALDAYNEACNEFAKFDDDDDDDDFDEDGTPFNGGLKDGDEEDFDEDEMEKMLIKHIVEKARQGSPMVLNAQRALFSESNL